MGRGQSGFMTVGQSKAKIYMETDVKVSFADLAGVDLLFDLGAEASWHSHNGGVQ